MSPADLWCAQSCRAAEMIESRLADARAHAEGDRLADAIARALELRSGLVGHGADAGAGRLRRRASFRSANGPARDGSPGSEFRLDDAGRTANDEARSGITRLDGRNHWSEAIQLSAPAIAELAKVSAAPYSACVARDPFGGAGRLGGPLT
jgi:hypothetical protein